MQNEDKQKYIKTQRRVFLTITLILLFCAFCALICNISVLKNIEIKNTFTENQAVLCNNSLFNKMQTCGKGDKNYVRIGGKPIGISIRAQGLIVAAKGSVATKNGDVYPLEKSQINRGDVLLSLNGEKVDSLYKLKKTLSELTNPRITFEYLHDNVIKKDAAVLAKDKADEKYKLGLALKEDVGGVGTLTFVTQDGKFAALGHKIADADTGLEEKELNEGKIYNATVSGVEKGERGKAGGLIADVNRFSMTIGEICDNTEIGLYGKYTATPDGDLYRIAAKGEARVGKAQVLTTIDGSSPKFYDVEIVKVVSQSEAAEKGMVVKVSDKELIAKTGGIVQGMSGSPIVQDGILIGAITHVFVQDPTRGYAVHSRFMFEKAQSIECFGDLRIEDFKLVA